MAATIDDFRAELTALFDKNLGHMHHIMQHTQALYQITPTGSYELHRDVTAISEGKEIDFDKYPENIANHLRGMEEARAAASENVNEIYRLRDMEPRFLGLRSSEKRAVYTELHHEYSAKSKEVNDHYREVTVNGGTPANDESSATIDDFRTALKAIFDRGLEQHRELMQAFGKLREQVGPQTASILMRKLQPNKQTGELPTESQNHTGDAAETLRSIEQLAVQMKADGLEMRKLIQLDPSFRHLPVDVKATVYNELFAEAKEQRIAIEREQPWAQEATRRAVLGCAVAGGLALVGGGFAVSQLWAALTDNNDRKAAPDRP